MAAGPGFSRNLVDRLRQIKTPDWLNPPEPVRERFWNLLPNWARPPSRRRVLMKPRTGYVNLRSGWRTLFRFGTPFFLAFFCLVYGFYFALTAPYLIVTFAAPIALMAALCIWALPESARAPTRTMEFFFATVLIGLPLWPNYLAIAMSGLPWITVIRLTGFPMIFLFLVSLSISKTFQKELRDTFDQTPLLWKLLVVFTVAQFIPMALAKNPAAALQKAVIHQINWTAMTIIAAYVGRTRGRVQFYVNLLLATSIPMLVIAVSEYGVKNVLWSGHIPPFLKIEDPVILRMLGGVTRGATRMYRAKATFSTPLGLAEFAAILVPFAIHTAVGNYKLWMRIFALILLPTLFYMVRLTDGRLGVVGFLSSFMLYLLFWGLLRFRRNRGDLVSSAIVYAYPAVLAFAYLAVTFIGPLHTLVLGGGATQASNWARENQLMMGVPKILANPIGYGAGGAGTAMGYGEGQFVAIDNYYLLLGLSYGAIGITAFLALFGCAIITSAKTIVTHANHRDDEIFLLIPLAVCLSEFLIIKSVLAQEDCHPLLFTMIGFIMALVRRAQTTGLPPPKFAAAHSAAEKPRRQSVLAHSV